MDCSRVTVVDHDAVAVDAEVGCPYHASVVGGAHGRVGVIGKVEPKMHLLVHFLAVVNVIADIGEVGFFLAPMDERAMPQNFLFGLEAQVGKLLVILAAHLAVDLQEIARADPAPAPVPP